MSQMNAIKHPDCQVSWPLDLLELFDRVQNLHFGVLDLFRGRGPIRLRAFAKHRAAELFFGRVFQAPRRSTLLPSTNLRRLTGPLWLGEARPGALRIPGLA